MTDVSELSGRKLDAAVAKEVMGYEVGRYNGDPFRAPELRPPGIKGGDEPLPPYSTDIAAAWGVVHEMWSDGDFMVHNVNHYWNDDNHWVAGRWDKWEPGFVLPGEGETAPEAIARAALKAVRNNSSTG